MCGEFVVSGTRWRAGGGTKEGCWAAAGTVSAASAVMSGRGAAHQTTAACAVPPTYCCERRRRAGRRHHSPKESAAPRFDRSKSVGERHWANVRAVMALYSRLRRIKRLLLSVLEIAAMLCALSGVIYVCHVAGCPACWTRAAAAALMSLSHLLHSTFRRKTKSNQRWMKLRTTVQLSGAISSTIQKKTPLKREDSFLKRFSTRQVAEQQYTKNFITIR
ncbi:hypothetical protein B566_EDAN008336 [Ephemera danica]|nr:hypothetical protein B566_EDAN008336 [Ephemera danica]